MAVARHCHETHRPHKSVLPYIFVFTVYVHAICCLYMIVAQLIFFTILLQGGGLEFDSVCVCVCVCLNIKFIKALKGKCITMRAKQSRRVSTFKKKKKKVTNYVTLHSNYTVCMFIKTQHAHTTSWRCLLKFQRCSKMQSNRTRRARKREDTLLIRSIHHRTEDFVLQHWITVMYLERFNRDLR